MKGFAVVLLVLVSACSGAASTQQAIPTQTTPAPTLSAAPTATTATSATASPTLQPNVGPKGGPVPKGFTPQSVTFVSTETGWALGDATCSTPPCTSIVRTRDGGRTWKGIPAPVAGIASEGGPSVRQIRFGDLLNGFAFTESLYATHDGGAHWRPLPVRGSVASLEVGHGRWWAVVEGCGLAVDPCTKSGRVVTGRVGSGTFSTVQQLPPTVTGQLVLQGAAVYLALSRPEQNATTPTLQEYSGGTFAKRAMPCDDTEVPYLAAAAERHLVLVCESQDAAAGTQGKSFFSSTDAGRTWTQRPKPAQIVGTALAATPSAVFVGNSRTGVEVSREGGAWSPSLRSDAGAGFVGFASPTFGEALVGQQLSLTRDAGRTWHTVAF